MPPKQDTPPRTRNKLWTCPECGHRFVTRNLWHSCGRYRLDDHFRGKDPVVRDVFDRLVAALRSIGPLVVYAQKTRIVFQVRVRFAGAVTRKHALQAHLWLTRTATHPRLRRVEILLPNVHVHLFSFDAPDQIDDAFLRLARDAYAIGRQEHLRPDRRIR
jgi:hypothetical protein